MRLSLVTANSPGSAAAKHRHDRYDGTRSTLIGGSSHEKNAARANATIEAVAPSGSDRAMILAKWPSMKNIRVAGRVVTPRHVKSGGLDRYDNGDAEADYRRHQQQRNGDLCGSKHPWSDQIEREFRPQRPADTQVLRKHPPVSFRVCPKRCEPVCTKQRDTRHQHDGRVFGWPRRTIDDQADDQQSPPKRKDTQETRAKKRGSPGGRRPILFMKSVADQKSADDVEEDHGAAANDIQPPFPVGSQPNLTKNAARVMPKNDAAGQKEPDCTHAPIPHFAFCLARKPTARP